MSFRPAFSNPLSREFATLDLHAVHAHNMNSIPSVSGAIKVELLVIRFNVRQHNNVLFILTKVEEIGSSSVTESW